MAFRLVKSGGDVNDPCVLNMYASGTVWPNCVVDFLPSSGAGISAASATSTQTSVFGVCLDYAEGASDTQVRVIPFVPGQIWEADCARAAATAHIGLKHKLRNSLLLENIAADADGHEGVFQVIGMTGSTSGSGKVLGIFMNLPRSADL